MKSNSSIHNLLRSKFLKPTPTTDLVLRTDLLNRLYKGRRKPLILISAPAGYGKSTLISSWLDHQSLNFGWISISEYDNDWLSFIQYFVLGLNNIVFGKFNDIVSLLESPEIPDADDISRFIVNNLTDLNEDIYLVLDDYHYLHDPEIHDFLNKILQFPLPRFHLVLISRVDPPFKIQRLRSKGLITEIRSIDLVFKLGEATEFFKNSIGKALDMEVCQSATNMTDGWITGLRLFSLNYKNKSGKLDDFFNVEHANFTIELLDEIFQEFSPEVQKVVLNSSILHQFNISICNKICDLSNASEVSGILDYLKTSNLFIVPVDEERGWFRFHHFFQDYLRNKFQETYSDKEQKTIHKLAGVWLREHELLKGAIIHFLKAGDIDEAVSVFENFRHQTMNEAQWIEFSEAFSLFDEETVKDHISLMLAQAWINIYVGKPFEMFALLEPIQALINNTTLSIEKYNRYLSELNCLIPYKTYNVDQDFHEVIKQCDFALDHLQEDQQYVKGFAWIFKLGALQAIGNYVEAKKLLLGNLEENQKSILDSHLYFIMNYLQWMEADFPALFETSTLLITSSIEGNKNLEAYANGNHFFGIGKYMINELEASKMHIEKCFASRFHTVGIVNIMNSIALVMLHLAQNNFSESERIIQEIKSEFKKKRSYVFNTMLDALHAEICLSGNDVDKALHYLNEVQQIPLTPFSDFYSPHFTLVKAFVYAEDASLWDKASNLLKDYLELTKNTHNKLFKMKFMALQSILYYYQGEFALAFSSLQEVLDSAKTHRLIRVFLDCGPMMKELLLQYLKSINNDSFVPELIHAFPMDSNEIVLSTREKDVLPLLNLSNKEIGEQLFIAEKTVKRHSNSIFKKLEVKNRREALQKATELKLV